MSVVFDRKGKVKNENDGVGTVYVYVYIIRHERKFISVGRCKRSDFEKYSRSKNVQLVVRQCENVLTTITVLNLDMSIENFNTYYNIGEEKGSTETKVALPKDLYNGVDQNTDFIEYMQKCVDDEDISAGTRKYKNTTIKALKRFGKIKTFKDLTPSNIMLLDKWLHDGTRTDVSVYTYHKNICKVVRRLFMMEMIPSNPYSHVTIKHGVCKERRPLTESELVAIRNFALEGKLDRVRDLFIVCAYTGLCYCDLMAFDFKEHAVKEGDLFYIDGSRLKTGSLFYTPILPPAMEVMKKYNFKLPHISNQKGNDYLHLVQAVIGMRKKMTFHVGRHSFATMMLSHGVPMEELARMMGHKDLKVTQIYGKILNSTIWNRSEAVIKEIL